MSFDYVWLVVLWSYYTESSLPYIGILSTYCFARSNYDLMGREIVQLVNTTQEAGYRLVQWNATDMHGKPVSAGIYLYQVRSGEFVRTKKMVLLK